jgi:hypothetical protein
MALMLAGAASAAKGDLVTFANFNETVSSVKSFSFTNTGTAPPPNPTFTAVSAPVTFSYSGIDNLPSDLQPTQNATLTMTVIASDIATKVGGTLFQPLAGMITFTRDAPAMEGAGGKTNLLTVNFTANNSPMNGTSNGHSASLSTSSTSDTVSFSSDFLDFSGSTETDLSIGFTSLSPALGINLVNNFLNSFSASGNGSFDSDPAPTVNQESLPEPSTYLLISAAAGVAVLIARLRHRLQQKRFRVPERVPAT